MQALDEKKNVIIQILNRLREFNPSIGNYDKSVMNSDFQYAVKLDNGRINLSQILVHDYEQSPSFVGDEQLKSAASKFTPDPVAAIVAPTAPLSSANPKPAPVQPLRETKKSSSRGLLILALLVVLGLGGYYLYTQINKESKANNKLEIKDNITDYVTVETNDYKHYEIGGIVDLEVIVTNKTEYTLDNVKVEITYIKKDGDVWKNQDVNTDMIGPRQYMTIKVPDTNRGTSVRCRITSVKSSSLGLN
jgi:hypothetical protein